MLSLADVTSHKVCSFLFFCDVRVIQGSYEIHTKPPEGCMQGIFFSRSGDRKRNAKPHPLVLSTATYDV